MEIEYMFVEPGRDYWDDQDIYYTYEPDEEDLTQVLWDLVHNEGIMDDEQIDDYVDKHYDELCEKYRNEIEEVFESFAEDAYEKEQEQLEWDNLSYRSDYF